MAESDTVTASCSRHLQPLSIQGTKPDLLEAYDYADCPLCDDQFSLIHALDLFVKHLFEVHDLVVEDIQNISNLPEYLSYWKKRFRDDAIEEIIPTVRVQNTDRQYFVLSTLMKEDKHLRHSLELVLVLKHQEMERTSSHYMRQCLFCRTIYEGPIYGFLDHLSTRHNLYLGDPQNLVYIEELIEKIDTKLTDLECLYCGKIFTDRAVLKEHMRKKLHKRIHEHNRDFDKFYIVNYLEPDRTWKAISKEDDRYLQQPGAKENSDDEYSDWNEKEDLIACLFCDKKENDINLLCLHMEADHSFDFADFTKTFDFYQKVKLVNYIRRQMYDQKCVNCDKHFDDKKSLQRHMYEYQHCSITNNQLFDQPEYYFPTFENDAFLYLIDDVEDDRECAV